MERYIIKITAEAEADMKRIYDYIAIKLMAPDTAVKQYNRIAESIKKLETFPEKIKR